MSTRTVAKAPGGGGGFGNLATGIYTGNGAANQAIAGVGFQPTIVLIYAQVNPTFYIAVKTDQDGVNVSLWNAAIGAVLYQADMIISLDADGFTVGDGTGLGNFFNVNLRKYTYICWA